MKGIFASLKSIMERFVPDWKKSGGVSEVRSERSRQIRRRAAPDKRKAKFRWRWDRIMVEANTKSEARAKIKLLRCLDRLPVGANIVKVAR